MYLHTASVKKLTISFVSGQPRDTCNVNSDMFRWMQIQTNKIKGKALILIKNTTGTIIWGKIPPFKNIIPSPFSLVFGLENYKLISVVVFAVLENKMTKMSMQSSSLFRP